MSCYDQFLIMMFAQLTTRGSLREIAIGLRAQATKLYHSGIRSPGARSTLSDANEKRDWRIFADFAQVLIGQASLLYEGNEFGKELKQTAYALDSTTIDLCMSLFPWAKFRHAKAAVKLHTLLALQGNYPTVVIITPGRVHDVNILDNICFEAGSFYVMDRAYLNFARLHIIHRHSAFFVTRTKDNSRLERRYSMPVKKSSGLRFDQTVILTGFYSNLAYPDPLRRIGFTDPETGRKLEFLTNNFTAPALTIAHLYRSRWQIELFFKWIKQHLHIKAFYGTSENAVKTQIWIAISVYVLIAILRKRFRIAHSPYTILQILSLTLFEKMPILQVFAKHRLQIKKMESRNQLNLKGF
jgi:IS4 transposase